MHFTLRLNYLVLLFPKMESCSSLYYSFDYPIIKVSDCILDLCTFYTLKFSCSINSKALDLCMTYSCSLVCGSGSWHSWALGPGISPAVVVHTLCLSAIWLGLLQSHRNSLSLDKCSLDCGRVSVWGNNSPTVGEES